MAGNMGIITLELTSCLKVYNSHTFVDDTTWEKTLKVCVFIDCQCFIYWFRQYTFFECLMYEDSNLSTQIEQWKRQIQYFGLFSRYNDSPHLIGHKLSAFQQENTYSNLKITRLMVQWYISRTNIVVQYCLEHLPLIFECLGLNLSSASNPASFQCAQEVADDGLNTSWHLSSNLEFLLLALV